jgi:hypothetical protein
MNEARALFEGAGFVSSNAVRPGLRLRLRLVSVFVFVFVFVFVSVSVSDSNTVSVSDTTPEHPATLAPP